MIEHRSVARLALANPAAPIGAHDCIAHCSNPAFDAMTWEVWSALLGGASLLVIDQPVLLDGPAFLRTLLASRANAMLLPVGLFNEYADLLAPAFARLKYLLVGGDVLNPALAARVLARAERPQHLINAYGPTRNHRVRRDLRRGRASACCAAFRSGVRPPIPRCTCWTATCSRWRWA
ncbi:AMP-binding protein [Massilia sp. H-1]|nr:AMP-binding protein [Massilia sp. H-1]